MSNEVCSNDLWNTNRSRSDSCCSNNIYTDQQMATSTRNNAATGITNNNITPVINLRSIDEIPEEYRPIFSSYHYFNVIQSKVLDAVLYTDESLAVSAPTGSGKTTIFELAVVRFLQRLNEFGQQIPYKIVYVAPLKALCEERLVDWFPKFSKLGLKCISVTGDSDFFDFQKLVNHNFIITTPEKWDSLTRRWRDNKNFVTFIKLFMIDEVHLVNDNHRGPTVEVIVSRMKTIQNSIAERDQGFDSMNLRFVAVSATIPNVEDIAKWLSMPEVKAKAFKFNDETRPVKLKKVVVGYNYNAQVSTPFKFDIMLNYKLQSIMLQHGEGKPTLIFCGTRKNVEMTSKHLTQNITINLGFLQKQKLQEACVSLSETKLKQTLIHGIGFHHAGLSPEDRKVVEDLFRNANLPILVTTSTLAMGINLPAHLVIIKSTKHYCNGGYQDYSESMLLQMIGRAGRPQFDNSATAVILTTASDKQKYENMMDGVQPVESNLHTNLTEHLNAEVVLNTITDLSVALEWVTTTFLYIRAGKNPKHYGFPTGLTVAQIDKKLLEMCHIQINKLARSGMLTIDQNNILIAPTQLGTLMAKYYVAFDTMVLFTQVSGTEILSQMLSLISKCQEFYEMRLRVDDKKTLNMLNKSRERKTIRYPFNEKIKTVDMKINCIVQAVFGCLPMLEASLVNESQKIMRIGERIANCLSEYLSTKHNCFSALLNTLILAKCFHAKLWENSPYVSRQLSGIGAAFSTALVEAGKTSFKDILESNPRDIERIINRKPPMGNTIQDQIEHLPKYELELNELCTTNNINIELKVHLQNAELLQIQSTIEKTSNMSLLVGDTNNDIILLENFKQCQFFETPTICKTFTFPLTYKQEIQAYFISADWVGIDCEANILPSHINKKLDIVTEPVIKQVDPKPKNRESRQKTSHIQMFVDTYFKHQKTPERRINKEVTRERGKRLAETKTCDSFNKIKRFNNNGLCDDKQVDDCNETTLNNSTLSTLQNVVKDSVKECEKIKESKLYTSCVTPDCYELSANFIQYPMLNNTTVISSTPYSTTVRRNKDENFEELNSQIKHNGNKYRLRKNMNCTVNFDSLLDSDEQSQDKSISAQFKYQPRKKLECTATSSTAQNTVHINDENDNSSISSVEEYMANMPLTTENHTPPQLNGYQKTITWSSPLVISPATKYSPVIAKGGPANTTLSSWINNNEVSRNLYSQAISDSGSLLTQGSVIRPTLKDNFRLSCNYPLSDKDFYAQKKQKDSVTNNYQELNTSSVDDIVSSTFLESFGIVKQPNSTLTTPTRKTNTRQYHNLSKPITATDYYLKTMSTSSRDNRPSNTIPKNAEYKIVNRTNVETQTSASPVKTTQDAATSPIKNTLGEPLFDISSELNFYQFNDAPIDNQQKLQHNLNAPEKFSDYNRNNFSYNQMGQTIPTNYKMLDMPELEQNSFIDMTKSQIHENTKNRFERYLCSKPVGPSRSIDQVKYQQNYYPDFVFSSQLYRGPQQYVNERCVNKSNFYEMDNKLMETSYYSDPSPHVYQDPINNFPKKLPKQGALNTQFLTQKKYDWLPYSRVRNDAIMMTGNQDSYLMSQNFNNSRQALQSSSFPFLNYENQIAASRPNSNSDLMFLRQMQCPDSQNYENGQSRHGHPIPRHSIAPEHFSTDGDDFENCYEK